MKTLGFIGTGGMGSGMAANLIKAGHRLVIHDLRREQCSSLESQGAVFKSHPARLPNPATSLCLCCHTTKRCRRLV